MIEFINVVLQIKKKFRNYILLFVLFDILIVIVEYFILLEIYLEGFKFNIFLSNV